MRVVVLGASGFIGAHVARELTDEPRVETVIRVGRSEVDLVRDGVDTLAATLRRLNPEAVVNCTGRLAGTGYELVTSNTVATAKLIEAIAIVNPGIRLVRLGSASEYGPVPHGRAVTEDDPATPVSEYGVSHLAGTRLLELASAAGRVDGVVLRIFNPIGAGLHEENMLGRAVRLLRDAQRRGERRIELGRLDSYRDFVDVRDVARAVRAAVTPVGLRRRVFNVGSGQAVTARHVVELLAGVAGFEGEILERGSGPARSTAVGWIRADVTRIRQVLGWSPAHELTDSLKAIWADGSGPA
jgi:NDP-hexose 4-ketoreductase